METLKGGLLRVVSHKELKDECHEGRWVPMSPSPFSPSNLHSGSQGLVQRLPGQLGVFVLK